MTDEEDLSKPTELTREETDQQKIDEILDNFDFERVHSAMLALNWRWQSTVTVPNIAHLRKKARELLKDVCKKKYDGSCRVEIGTGGLRAERSGDFLRLSFVVSDWDSYA